MIAPAPRPANRSLERLPGTIVGRGMFETLVEHHRDVRSKTSLHVNGRLGRQEMLAAVEMRPESHTRFLHLSPRSEAEHLVAAAVGQDRLVPSDELMKSARRRDSLGARPQIEMVGICENDFRADVLQITMGHRLDRPLSAHCHECGGVRPRHGASAVCLASRRRALRDVQNE